jgi:acetyl esterase/lipase
VKRAFFTALFLLFVSLIHAEIIYNIPYVIRGNRMLYLDLYLPNQRLAPCVILIRGGGWRHGDKEQLAYVGIQMMYQGFAAASIEYRTSDEAIYPAAKDDVVAAVEWLAHYGLNYGIDGNALTLFGVSAGAHLASLVGTNDFSAVKVKAVISISGIYDFTTDEPGIGAWKVEAFLGGPHWLIPAKWKDASTIYHVSADSAPMMLFHGVSDLTVPPQQAIDFLNELNSWGIPSRLYLYSLCGHGVPIAEWLSGAIEFLRKYARASGNIYENPELLEKK